MYIIYRRQMELHLWSRNIFEFQYCDLVHATVNFGDDSSIHKNGSHYMTWLILRGPHYLSSTLSHVRLPVPWSFILAAALRVDIPAATQKVRHGQSVECFHIDRRRACKNKAEWSWAACLSVDTGSWHAARLVRPPSAAVLALGGKNSNRTQILGATSCSIPCEDRLALHMHSL